MFMYMLLPVLASATSVDQFITQGVPQDIADFPFQGSYRTATGSHTCGCVFVGANYVLTAGHCGGSDAYSMKFGSSLRSGDDDGVIANIQSVLRHPDYGVGEGFTPNDIAIIYATNVISGNNDTVSPATLQTTPENPGGRGFITGWGRQCGGCNLVEELLGRDIPIIADSQCAGSWGSSFNEDSMICVFDGVGGACNGDSGGPLSKDGTVVGLASWVASRCLASYPSVYTRVGAYTEWICSNTDNGAEGCFV